MGEGAHVYLSRQCLHRSIIQSEYIWKFFFYVLIVPSMQRAMAQQFGDAGKIWVFMRQMSLQGFTWASLHRMTLFYIILALSFMAFTKGSFVFVKADGELIRHQCNDEAAMFSKFLDATDYASIPCFGLVLMMYVGIQFQVFMTSKLHEYDLLCYSGALAKTFEENTENPLPLLQEVEKLIGDRFRHASETWAATTIRCCVLLGFSFIFMMFELLSIDSLNRKFWLVLGKGLSFLTALLLLVFPMAQVSETFHYDVLRALNNPLIIKQAQRHLGEQLLSHLQSLDWGFRVGGTVLSKRQVTTITMAVLTSMVATISQKVTNDFVSLLN